MENENALETIARLRLGRRYYEPGGFLEYAATPDDTGKSPIRRILDRKYASGIKLREK